MNPILDRIYDVSAYERRTERTRAQFLYLVLSIAFLPITLVFIATLAGQIEATAAPPAMVLALSIAAYSLLLVSLLLVRAGRANIAAYMIVGGLATIVTVALFTIGFSSPFQFLTPAIIILMSGLLLSQREILIATLAWPLIFVIGTQVNNVTGLGPIVTLIIALVYMIFGALGYAYLRVVAANRYDISSQESSERGKLATLTTQITRMASQRVPLHDAMYQSLDLILKNYQDMYHAQIFLIDDSGIRANLVASTGAIGSRLIEESHGLTVGSLSVIGQTTYRGEPVIAYANQPDTIHKPNPLLPDTQLEAAFPLQIENRIIGALDLQSKQTWELSEEDRFTYQSMADSLSLVIDNLRQFEEAKARVDENQRLAEQARSALREVERLNQRLIGRAWSEYLVGQEDNLGLDVDFASGTTTNAVDWTATLRDAAQINSVVQQGSVIALPLKVRGHVIGALEFELDQEGEFSPEDLELIQEVSNRFGLAIENIRLLEESQRIAQRETLINEISSRMQAANNVEDTLTEAARSLSEALQANRVAIRLGVPDQTRGSRRILGNGITANGKEK